MASAESNRFFVITGGPGSGKSALIDALAERGFAKMPEAGRAIIQDQVSIGGKALPWDDRIAFAELMLSWDLRSYREALALKGPVVFDRGVADVVGYLHLCQLPIPAHIQKAAQIYRYNPRVFIAPPWYRIFDNDRERKQDFAEAQATYQALFDTYSSLGYELVHLPLVSIQERLQFVIETAGL